MERHPFLEAGDLLLKWHDKLQEDARRRSLPDPECLASQVIAGFMDRWDNHPTPKLNAYLNALEREGRVHGRPRGGTQELKKLAKRRRYKRMALLTDEQQEKLKSRPQPPDFETIEWFQHLLAGATLGEQQVAERLAVGMTIDEIAEDLQRSKRTVYDHCKRLRRRFQRALQELATER